MLITIKKSDNKKHSVAKRLILLPGNVNSVIKNYVKQKDIRSPKRKMVKKGTRLLKTETTLLKTETMLLRNKNNFV